jgi:hypothetical protein
MTESEKQSDGKMDIGKVWEVSTVHITQNDAALLETPDSELVAFPYAEGVWVLVPDDDAWGDMYDNSRYEDSWFGYVGFSPAVSHILSIARSHKIRYVRLDADAEIYDFLEEHHW